MSTRHQELLALAEELCEARRLSPAEAMAEADRLLQMLSHEALAWDHQVVTAQDELKQYELAWDSMSNECRARRGAARRQSLAA